MERNFARHRPHHTSSSTHPITLDSSPPPRHLAWNSPTLSPEPRGTKRRRISSTNATTSVGQHQPDEEAIEAIDLTEAEGPSAIAKALAKQREDAVKSQRIAEDETGRSLLTAYKCPVCMDTPVDATSTVCGHLFCHKCIIDTLKFGEEQRADSAGKGPRGTCPVCRKPLTRADAPGPKRNLVPLQLKIMTKKRNPVSFESA